MLRIAQRNPRCVAYGAAKPEKWRIWRDISDAYVAYTAHFGWANPRTNLRIDERTRENDERTHHSAERTRPLANEPEGTVCRTS